MTSNYPSDALVRISQNITIVSTTPLEESRRQRSWALFFHTYPSPGRTLDRVYTSLGRVLERQANRAAYRLGLGPHVIAKKIKSFFGNGEQRVQVLEVVRDSLCLKLEKLCWKLMRYTLPTESADTQCQAFKDVVDLVSLFPGLRIYFLRAKSMENAMSTDTIFALWDRSTGPPDEEWTFWNTLAAVCLSDTVISAILEDCSIAQLTSCEEERLTVIEQLLIQHDCSGTSYARAISMRYLGGILDLPGFWLGTGNVHSVIVTKLCCAMVWVLKDIGVDIPTLGPIIDETEAPFDYDGVDALAATVLVGIANLFAKLDREEWAQTPWFQSFRDFLALLRRPRSAELLPNSSTLATHNFKNILPTMYRDAELNVLVDIKDTTVEENQGTNPRNNTESKIFEQRNHFTPGPSVQEDNIDGLAQISDVDPLELQSQNEEKIASHTSGHTQIQNSEIDSAELQSQNETEIAIPGESQRFEDIVIPECGPDYHQTDNGDGHGNTGLDNPASGSAPCGMTMYTDLGNQTLATRRHAVPLTPYTSTQQSPVEPRDSDSSQVFQVKMGTVEGVVPGTEFSAFAPNNTFLCTFVAQSVKISHTILVSKLIDNQPPLAIPYGTCAEISNWKNESMILFVHISHDFLYSADLFPVTRTRQTLKFVQALSLEKAHIVVRSNGKEIVIEPRTSTMLKCQREIRFTLRSSPTCLPDAMDGIAHFNYFLDRSNEADTLKGKLTLEMHRLLGDYPHRTPDMHIGQDGNMVRDGEALFPSKAGAKYGFTISNTSPVDLFPYFFYFDPEEYTIQCLYKPAGPRVQVPLPANGTKTIGMGNEAAFEFSLPLGEESSSGFFKLFVVSEYIDFKWIQQEVSPFDPLFRGGTRGPILAREHLNHMPTWDALLAILTITA